MPKRIQLKRTKGWRMPENTVKVDRTNKRFGNPFVVGKDGVGDAAHAVEFFKAMIDQSPGLIECAKIDLRGKNLACWCKLGTPCHAEVLLEIANS